MAPVSRLVPSCLSFVPFDDHRGLRSASLELPIAVSKTTVHIVMDGENVNQRVVNKSRLKNVPESSKIRSPLMSRHHSDGSLMDMGFPRSAAERSLLRSRNNVSATTEFLLSHPFPLPPDPIPEAASAEE